MEYDGMRKSLEGIEVKDFLGGKRMWWKAMAERCGMKEFHKYALDAEERKKHPRHWRGWRIEVPYDEEPVKGIGEIASSWAYDGNVLHIGGQGEVVYCYKETRVYRAPTVVMIEWNESREVYGM